MDRKFYLASTNEHKAIELNELFENKISILPSPTKLEVIEDGQTFFDNALIKARAYYEKLKSPTLADDSGLVIPQREDILGVHSARYAQDLPDYKDKNERLLKDLKDLKGEDRKAYFVCVLCFYLSPSEYYFFEGRLQGEVGFEARGNEGFGYDPIFYPEGLNGKSLAEAGAWKMQNSHRFKAKEAALKFLKP